MYISTPYKIDFSALKKINSLRLFTVFKISKIIIKITVSVNTVTIGNIEIYNSGIFTYNATLNNKNKIKLTENQINV